MGQILKYEIKKHIGVIGKNGKGWEKQLNVVSWANKTPSYDLRSWNFDEDRPMGKGIVLTEEELFALGDIINKMKVGEI